MKDRLKALIDESTADVCGGFYGDEIVKSEIDITEEEIERIADYLLANGAIVPPCKVGDTVYVDGDTWSYFPIHYESRFIHSKYFVVGEIVSIIKTKKQLLMKIRVDNSIHTRHTYKRYTVNAIGVTVFLTKEEAEQALKEREKV